jgi:hypothetical protein
MCIPRLFFIISPLQTFRSRVGLHPPEVRAKPPDHSSNRANPDTNRHRKIMAKLNFAVLDVFPPRGYAWLEVFVAQEIVAVSRLR